MKVLLVGNYVPDGQESMQRFAEMLRGELTILGHDVHLLRPRAVAAQVGSGTPTVGKWFGYLDKYVLFPPALTDAARWADIVHICDQSNAVYLPHVMDKPHIVTCHDLMAIRGALGEDTDCPASPLGKVLQRTILERLKRAQVIACDSTKTREDVERLTGQASNTCLVHVGLNYPYCRLGDDRSKALLEGIPGLSAGVPHVLHVGSSEPRKNRAGVVRIFSKIAGRFPGQLVFAGEALSTDALSEARELGLTERIVQVVKPSNPVLNALYCRAHALLFPSKAEGFGWPVIEAQASGCPVVCTSIEPLLEVSGGAALFNDFADEEGFAASLIKLNEAPARASYMKRALRNAQKFSAAETALKYSLLYERVHEHSLTSTEPRASSQSE